MCVVSVVKYCFSFSPAQVHCCTEFFDRAVSSVGSCHTVLGLNCYGKGVCIANHLAADCGKMFASALIIH